MLGSLTFPSTTFLNQKPLHRHNNKMSIRASTAELSPPSSTSTDRKSLYEVLKVKQNASRVEIKSAYRTLAKLYHPDATSRFMDSSIAQPHDFIEIHEAYETLSDPDSRAVYDLNLSINNYSQHRRNMNSTGGGDTFYRTRRWETDQCW